MFFWEDVINPGPIIKPIIDDELYRDLHDISMELTVKKTHHKRLFWEINTELYNKAYSKVRAEFVKDMYLFLKNIYKNDINEFIDIVNIILKCKVKWKIVCVATFLYNEDKKMHDIFYPIIKTMAENKLFK